jgi:NAD/NADP transhydrogenase beta subunit
LARASLTSRTGYFFRGKTMMLCRDAKKMTEEIVQSLG